MLGKILFQHLPQVFGNSVHSTFMGKDNCRLTVWIGVGFRVCLYYPVKITEQVVNGNAVRQFAGFDKILLPLARTDIFTVALQDYQIAADFCSCMVGKEIVRQTDSRYHIASVHQVFPYRLVLF